MNRQEVYNAILSYSHRTDLNDQIDQFIDNVSQRLRKRLGMDLPFTGLDATNVISDDYPEIYIYGGMRELALYTQDAEMAELFAGIYTSEVDRLNITAESTDFTDDTPVVLNELELAIKEAASGT